MFGILELKVLQNLHNPTTYVTWTQVSMLDLDMRC